MSNYPVAAVYLHSVNPPFCTPPLPPFSPNLKKRVGVGLTGPQFFLNFYINKLKPKIFNDIIKYLNWEILTKNLVTFKRWDGVKDKKFNIMEVL